VLFAEHPSGLFADRTRSRFPLPIRPRETPGRHSSGQA